MCYNRNNPLALFFGLQMLRETTESLKNGLQTHFYNNNNNNNNNKKKNAPIMDRKAEL